MDKEYWQQKWEAQDTRWHQPTAHPFLQAYASRLNLHKGDTILVPLCGKAKDMIWLVEQGYHVIGVELSPIACDAFFCEWNVNVSKKQTGPFIHYQSQDLEIYCGDIFNLNAQQLPAIQAIFDCRALVALPEAMQVRYVQHLYNCAGLKASLLLLTVESTSNVVGPPFSLNDEAVRTLMGEHRQVEVLARVTNPVVPKHLIAKGYQDFIEAAYLITSQG